MQQVSAEVEMRALWHVKRRNESSAALLRNLCLPFPHCWNYFVTSTTIQHSSSRELMKRSFRRCLKNNTNFWLRVAKLKRIMGASYLVKDTKRKIFIRVGSASCTFEKRVEEHKAAARYTTMSSKKYYFYNAYPDENTTFKSKQLMLGHFLIYNLFQEYDFQGIKRKISKAFNTIASFLERKNTNVCATLADKKHRMSKGKAISCSNSKYRNCRTYFWKYGHFFSSMQCVR